MYKAHKWKKGELITAEKLNNMEEGAVEAVAALENARSEIEQATADILETIPDDYAQLDASVSTLQAANVRYSSRFSNALIGHVTGTGSVSVDDSAEATIPALEVAGNSAQVVTTGAQLFDANIFDSIQKNGISVINNGDGSFAVRGTATTYAGCSGKISLLPGTYTVSGRVGSARFFVRTFKNATDFIDYDNKTFQIVGDEFKIYVGIQVDIGQTADAVIWPMLNEGDTAIPWEPYTGGKPAPSPDYPQAISGTCLLYTSAYDQLRYLKNKDTYVYENKTATEVVQMIAADFNLSVGAMDDTGFKIESRSEPDKTLFDIILTALGLTTISTGQMYTLYDDYGKLTLKNMANMKLDILIDDTTGQDYSYTSSIDGETYNQVKVSIDNEETGKRDTYIAKHTENINSWGVLQHYYKADSKETNGQAVADQLLAKYNRKTKKLSIKGAFGDIRVRAGCLIPIMLDLGDAKLNNYMLVEKVDHTFEGKLHTMDLVLRGGEFSA